MSNKTSGLAAKPVKPIKAWAIAKGGKIVKHDGLPLLSLSRKEAVFWAGRGEWGNGVVRVTITVEGGR
jgi:hypothetical protein